MGSALSRNLWDASLFLKTYLSEKPQSHEIYLSEDKLAEKRAWKPGVGGSPSSLRDDYLLSSTRLCNELIGVIMQMCSAYSFSHPPSSVSFSDTSVSFSDKCNVMLRNSRDGIQWRADSATPVVDLRILRQLPQVPLWWQTYNRLACSYMLQS